MVQRPVKVRLLENSKDVPFSRWLAIQIDFTNFEAPEQQLDW